MPRRSRLCKGRHLALPWEVGSHLEKEPDTSAVGFQMQPGQAPASLISFPGPQGLLYHRLHLLNLKSLNLAEKTGGI